MFQCSRPYRAPTVEIPRGEISVEYKYRVGGERKPTLGRNTNGNGRAGKLLPCEYKYKFTLKISLSFFNL